MSNNNNESDFRNTDLKEIKKAEFPVEVFKEYRVYFTQEAYDEMKEHANLTNEVELGGVLIGDICKDSEGAFLKVCAAIPGEHSNNYGAQVTFTHETWQHINETKDSKYPDKKIVGWYHTHPGFGVFLSEMDNFIQDNFFNQPYQIAVVMETKENVEGCFIWKDGKSFPIQRYWVGDKEIELVGGKVKSFNMGVLPSDKKVSINLDESENKSYVFSSGFMSVAIMIMLFFLGFLWGQNIMFSKIKDIYEMMESEIFGLFEYGALNTTAQQDLDVIQQKLKGIQRDSLAENKGASEKLDEVSKFIDDLKPAYDKNRLKFRKELMKIQTKKDNLSQRVAKNKQMTLKLQNFVANISILRIKEIYDKSGGDLKNLTREDLQSLSYFIVVALDNEPASKTLIRKNCPGLMEQLMPEKFRDEEKEKNKKPMTTPNSGGMPNSSFK